MFKKINYSIIALLILVMSLYSQDTYRQLKVREFKKVNTHTTVYITETCEDTVFIKSILSYYKKANGIPWSKVVFDCKITDTKIEYGMYVYDVRALYNRQAFEIDNQKHETLNEMHYGGLFGSMMLLTLDPKEQLSRGLFQKLLIEKYPKKFYSLYNRLGKTETEITQVETILKDLNIGLKLNFGLIDKENFVLYESDIFEHRLFYKWMEANKL